MPTAFARSVRLFIDANLAPEAQSQRLADFARTDVAKLISSGRAPSTYKRFVDGREGVSEDEVKPSGAITYIFDFLGDVIPEAIKFLRSQSPVLTGKYRDSFYVAIGDARMLATNFDQRFAAGATEVFIYNIVPYSRKVDVQRMGNTIMHFSMSPNIFANCAQMLKSRFGNSVLITRVSDVAFSGKYVLRRTQMRPRPRSHQVLRSIGDLVESPGIMITTQGG